MNQTLHVSIIGVAARPSWPHTTDQVGSSNGRSRATEHPFVTDSPACENVHRCAIAEVRSTAPSVTCFNGDSCRCDYSNDRTRLLWRASCL
jgi:hypothetical protein